MRSAPVDGAPKEVFSCECGQSYSRLEYLRRHQRKHDDVRPFGCNICEKSFARSDVLLRHKRRCHPTETAAEDAQAALNNVSGLSDSARRSSGNGPTPSSTAGNKRPADRSPSWERPSQKQRVGSSGFAGDSNRADDYSGWNGDRGGYGDYNYSNGAGDYGDRRDDYGNSFGRDDQGSSSRAGNGMQIDPALNALVGVPMFDPGFRGPGHGLSGKDAGHTTTATGMGLHDLAGYMLGTSAEASQAWATGDHAQDVSSAPKYATEEAARNTTFADVDEQWRQQFKPAGDDANNTPGSNGSDMQNHGIEDAATLLSMAYGLTAQGIPGLLSDPQVGNVNGDQQQTGTAEASTSNGKAPDNDNSAPQNLSTAEQEKNLIQTAAELGFQRDPDMGWVGTAPLEMQNEIKDIGSGWPELMTQQTDVLTPGFLNSLFSFTSLAEEEEYGAAAQVDGLSYLPGSSTELTSFNPSRPFARIMSAMKREGFGAELSMDDRYYITEDRFAGCYTIPHWGMPSMQTLKRIARQTVGTLLHQLPIIHLPTFQLHNAPLPVSFAVCTVGSPTFSSLTGDQARGMLDKPMLLKARAQMRDDWIKGLGVVAPVSSSDQIIELEDNPTDEERLFEDRKKVIANEKSAMMYNIFLAGSGRLLTEYNFGILQALLMFSTPTMLSPRPDVRACGYKYLTPCIEMAQQMSMFDPEEELAKMYGMPAQMLATSNTNKTLKQLWKDWIKLESYRRTLFILYVFDTLRNLETGTAPALQPKDLANMPLPAPDSLWRAKTAEEWNVAATMYHASSLDSNLQKLFRDEGSAELPGVAFAGAPKEDLTTNSRTEMGSFARLVVVISLLKGIIDVGQGKRCQGTWRDVTDLWMTPQTAELAVGAEKLKQDLRTWEVLQIYGTALQRWRQGWDFDTLCPSPYGPNPPSDPLSMLTSPASMAAGPSPFNLGSSGSPGLSGAPGLRAGSTSSSEGNVLKTPEQLADVLDGEEFSAKSKEQILFYEEALPYYWISQALQSMLCQDRTIMDSKRGGSYENNPAGRQAMAARDALAGTYLGAMLQSARIFTRMGEGTSTSPEAAKSA